MLNILHEDNHLIILNKPVGQLVQQGKESENFQQEPLETEVKQYLKETYQKQGEAFIGIPHRLDCPVSGIVVMAKTSKALVRINQMFQDKVIKKYYHAIVKNKPVPQEGLLTHYLVRNERKNQSYVVAKSVKNAKIAQLRYLSIGASQHYFLLEVELLTGRHHQIRTQLSAIGCPIKGDLKYGAERSNPNGGIGLHARRVIFEHPVSHTTIDVIAPYFESDIWNQFTI